MSSSLLLTTFCWSCAFGGERSLCLTGFECFLVIITCLLEACELMDADAFC